MANIEDPKTAGPNRPITQKESTAFNAAALTQKILSEIKNGSKQTAVDTAALATKVSSKVASAFIDRATMPGQYAGGRFWPENIGVPMITDKTDEFKEEPHFILPNDIAKETTQQKVVDNLKILDLVN